MSKVNIKNVSRDKSPFYCGLSDNTSLSLQYGQVKTIDKSLVTDYIFRMADNNVLFITDIPEELQTSDKDNKQSGKKKATNKLKEV